MRIHKTLMLAVLVVGAVAVGCGVNEVDMGSGGSTPTPTPTVTATPTPGTPPTAALFAAVQTYMEDPAKANCAQSTACHMTPGNGGLVFVTTPQGAVPAGDVTNNSVLLSCLPNIDDYTPSGLIIQTFCTAGGTALTGIDQHGGRTILVDADCAALFAWLQTGTGTPDACP